MTNKEEAKRIYNEQLARISALEANKGLTEIELELIQRQIIGGMAPTTHENGEIKNPVSTCLHGLADENWEADIYRGYIKKFIDLDVKLQLINYISIYLKYNQMPKEEELGELYADYIEDVIEDTEGKKSSEAASTLANLNIYSFLDIDGVNSIETA